MIATIRNTASIRAVLNANNTGIKQKISEIESDLMQTESRLSESIEGIRDSIFNTENLLLGANIVHGKYFASSEEVDAPQYSYAVIPMKSGVTYVISKARFIAYSRGVEASNTQKDYEFTPNRDENVYVTFYNDTATHGEWYVYEKGKDPSKIGTYQHPYMSDKILSRGLGDDDNIAVSQKVVTAISDEIAEQAETIAGLKNGIDVINREIGNNLITKFTAIVRNPYEYGGLTYTWNDQYTRCHVDSGGVLPTALSYQNLWIDKSNLLNGVAAGDKLFIVFDATANEQDIGLRIVIYDAGGNQIDNPIWYHGEYEYIVPTDAVGMQVMLRATKTSKVYDCDISFSISKYRPLRETLAKFGDDISEIDSGITSINGEIAGINRDIETLKLTEFFRVPDDIKGSTDDSGPMKLRSETKLDDLYGWYDMLTQAFNHTMEREQIGTTSAPTGINADLDNNTYPIYAYHIYPTKESRATQNVYMLVSGIHGDSYPDVNEYPSDVMEHAVSVAYFTRELLLNPLNNSTTKYIREHCHTIIVPAINAWGYQNGRRNNGRGVDLNRNFPIGFVPNREDYPGASSGSGALSEEETKGFSEFVTRINNVSPLKFVLDVQARGGWRGIGNTDNRYLFIGIENAELQTVCNKIGETMEERFGGIRDLEFYSETAAKGELRDWVLKSVNRPSWTMETFAGYPTIASRGAEIVMKNSVAFVGEAVCEYVRHFIMG